MSGILSNLILVGVLFAAGWYAFTQTDLFSGGLTRLLHPTNTIIPKVQPLPIKTIVQPVEATKKGKAKNIAPAAAPTAIAAAAGCGNTIYKATGRKANTTDTGPQGQAIHYASSGKAASSRRLNANNTPFNAIEATIYFTFNGTQCGKPDPEMTIKLWGPVHSNNNCCWCLYVVTASGKVCFGGEGPHPSTTTCQQAAGNVGNLNGKNVGLKAVIWPTQGGAHQEIYIDTAGNGAWKLMGTRQGVCGKDKTSATVSPAQQVEFRIDCKNVTVKCASVMEIVPSTKAHFAHSIVEYDGRFHYTRPLKSFNTTVITHHNNKFISI